jgi:ribosomal-protein-alanine N-acetyltransferase
MSLQDLSIRVATPEDRHTVAALMHFETHVHRHLDWRSPLDCLGSQPYLIAEWEGRPVGTLACPPDPPGIGWIRLFASSAALSVEEVWAALWENARQLILETHCLDRVAAIPLQSWFKNLLKDSGFSETHQVVMLSWSTRRPLPETVSLPGTITIRPMNFDDLPLVQHVDEAAFQHEWRNSLESLQVAFQQAEIATIADLDGMIIGYQISTPSQVGLHLSRLAVHPISQGHGTGAALLRDVMSQSKRRGVANVTVNTQKNNSTSLSLYQRAGFQLTGEEYPVYQTIPMPLGVVATEGSGWSLEGKG